MFKKLGEILTIGVVFAAFFYFLPAKVLAVDCSTTSPVTINIACSFPGTDTGVDSGTGETNSGSITIATGGALTILAGQTVAGGTLVISGGYVTIIDTGKYVAGMPIWVYDTDLDGYPAAGVYIQTSQPVGAVRSNTLANPTTTDCYDSNANARPGQTTCYTAHRGDGSFDYNCDSSPAACNSCNTSSTSTPSLPWRQCDAFNVCWTDPYDTYFTGYTCSGSTSTCGASGVTCTGSKASSCVASPCSLSAYYATGTTGCTVSCK